MLLARAKDGEIGGSMKARRVCRSLARAGHQAGESFLVVL